MSVYSAGAHYKVGCLLNSCYSLAGSPLSSRSTLRVQLPHLMIPHELLRLLAICKFPHLAVGIEDLQYQIGLDLQGVPFQGCAVQRGAQLCLQGRLFRISGSGYQYPF